MNQIDHNQSFVRLSLTLEVQGMGSVEVLERALTLLRGIHSQVGVALTSDLACREFSPVSPQEEED